MDEIPSIDFTKGYGPVVLGLLAFIVPLAVRTYLKDRRENKERAQQLLLTLSRMAYNSVQNLLKKGFTIEDKQEAGVNQLRKIYLLRVGRDPTFAEIEQARMIFDAIHGELCPGGTGTPPLPPPT